MMIEIHMLQNHAPCNLNRDESGSPKDCIFGGYRRSRISSQSIKRSIRKSDLFKAGLDENNMLGTRTRHLPGMIEDYLLRNGMTETVSKNASLLTKDLVIKEKSSKKESDDDNTDIDESADNITGQIIFVSEEDVRVIGDKLINLINENKEIFDKTLNKTKASKFVKDLKNDDDLKKWRPITPDIALFGRMTTSDVFMNVQASMQVAHAISTNKMDSEFDFFTAVDDLQKAEEETGVGMIGDIEFNSASYYKYFCLDFDGFVRNLTGPAPSDNDVKKAKELALSALKSFIDAAVFTNPSGKQNSFAAHQLPDAVFIEVKDKKIPVSYANAFLTPCSPQSGRTPKSLMDVSIEKFIEYAQTLQKDFAIESEKFWFTTMKTSTDLGSWKVSDSYPDLVENVCNLVKNAPISD